jgi:hypothetical protein
MSFLALSPAAAYALLAGVALAILVLHLLRPPPPRVLVPSLLLWARLGRSRKPPAKRRLLLLLLALGAGLSLALALTEPEVPALGAGARRLTLVLDNSPSMAARAQDGRTRWQHAVEGARKLLQRSAPGSEVMLLDTAGQLRVTGFVDRDAALAALAGVPLPAWSVARLPAAALAAGAQAHLFTDGVAPIELPDTAIVHSVFEPGDNVAVTAFEARPLAQDPTRYEALVQVLNASPGDQRVRLLLRGGDRFSVAQDLDVRAGESVNATFDVSDFESGVLGAAAVSPSDAFALDDVAYAVIPPHSRKRVLLVSSGNPPLEDALRSVPGVDLAVVGPARYASAARYDAIVFDRFAPPDAPPAGAVLLRPPARKWLGGHSTAVGGARVTGWNENHAVTRGTAWRSLRLARAAVEAVGETSDALVLASGRVSGALVTAGESRARWVKVGFALQDSNFALQSDFPVFLGKALSWVSEPLPVLVRGLGSVEVPLREAQVHDGSGKPVAASVTARGIVFEAPRADVYTVSAPAEQILVVANVAAPSYALINRTRFGAADPAAVERSAPSRLRNAEPWTILLLLAGALLLVEWAVFTRRSVV